MMQGFHIHHPVLFLIPVMLLLTIIQLSALRRRKRGLAAEEWPKTACVVLAVVLGVVFVFAKF
ncbi:hypothetical protein HDF16_006112 [Granulicella aggregans]|uniref:Uncharacterized protein n=1 Tax=Granulicella aggregans TaxID=474949 RepID=A0A7W7ZLE8_9BACT|nr:hypothetical protein [Granulicella aggregans]